MQNSKTRNMVLCAIFSAIIVVMTLVPYTGYINYGLFIEITTLHIVVILGAVAMGWKYGAILGGVWGVTCVARAFTNLALWGPFANPLISVLPRIVVGIVAGAVYAGLSRKMGDKPTKSVHAVIIALCSGGLVMAALMLGKNGSGQSLAWPVGLKIAVAVAVAAAVAAMFVYLNKRYGNWNAYAAAVAALCASLTNTVLVLTAFSLFGGMIKDFETLFNMFKGILTTIIGINGAIELLAAVIITPVLTMAVFRQYKKAD